MRISIYFLLFGSLSMAVLAKPPLPIPKGNSEAKPAPYLQNRNYTIQAVPISGYKFSTIIDIGENGIIGGYGELREPTPEVVGQTFIIEHGKISLYAEPDSLITSVPAVSNDGNILAGNWGDSEHQRAGYYDRKRGFWIQLPDYDVTRPMDFIDRITESGLMLGNDCMGSWYGGVYGCVNWIWDGVKYTVLNYPNPPYEEVMALGMNNRGQIAGYSWNADGTNMKCLLLEKGVVTELKVPEDLDCMVWPINATGSMVVGLKRPRVDPWFTFYLYRDGELLELPELPGSTGSYLVGIDAKGVICGQALFADGTAQSVILTPKNSKQ